MRVKTVSIVALVGLCFVVGVLVTGGSALRHGLEVAPFDRAAACPAGSPVGGDCLSTVDGSVTGVSELGGKSPDFGLGVHTAAGDFDASFPADSSLLSRAVDGESVTVTLWRGVPVRVAGPGAPGGVRTWGDPELAFAHALGHCCECAGPALICLLLVGMTARPRVRRAGGGVGGPVESGLLTGGLGAGIVLELFGFVVAAQPTALVGGLEFLGAGVAASLGFGGWRTLYVRRSRSRSRNRGRSLTGGGTDKGANKGTSKRAGAVAARTSASGSVGRAAVQMRERERKRERERESGTRKTVRTRLSTAGAGVRAGREGWYDGLCWAALGLLLVLGFIATHDAVTARAYRSAPACVGGFVPAGCKGELSAAVAGVRTSTGQDPETQVEFTMPDGAPAAQAAYYHATAVTVARLASAAQAAGRSRPGSAAVPVRAWRTSVLAAEFDGAWYWADGAPPGCAVPVAAASAVFGLYFVVRRWRIRVLSGRGGWRSRRLLGQDAGQGAAAVASISLTALGFGWAAVLVAGTVVWTEYTARRVAPSR